MSAAEKLRALEPEPLSIHHERKALVLYDALPQIVAVVKAAEICRSEWQMGSILATALDALDEALP